MQPIQFCIAAFSEVGGNLLDRRIYLLVPLGFRLFALPPVKSNGNAAGS